MTTPTHIPARRSAEEIAAPQPWERDPDAVIFEWMTAGGMNTPEQVDHLIADDPHGAEAWQELLKCWTIWVDLDDLHAALSRFYAARPDRAARAEAPA